MVNKMSVDDILEELNQGEHMKVDRQGTSTVDMDKIDELIREILTKSKEEELKKDSREFTDEEKAEIEREVRVQTNSLTRRFAAIQTEQKKGHTAAIRVQISGEVDNTPAPTLGMGVEAFKEMHKARMQRVDAFVLEPKKPPEIQKEAPTVDSPLSFAQAEADEADLSTKAEPLQKEIAPEPEAVSAEEVQTKEMVSEPETPVTPANEDSNPKEQPTAQESSILLNAAIENTAAETIVETPHQEKARTLKTSTEEYELTEEDEYVFPSQQPQVAAMMRKWRRRAQVSCVMSGICAFLGILLACVQMGKESIYLFGVVEIPSLYYAVSNLALLVLCLIANFPMFDAIGRGSKKDGFALMTLLFTAACGVFFTFAPQQIVSGYAVMYAPVMSLSLFAGACARVWQAKRQEKSFLFMTEENSERYGVSIAQENAVSRELARGLSVEKEAVLASNVKADFFDGFLTRQQKGTPIDATYGRFALGAFFLGICCAGGYYAITSNLYGALTVFSAVEALAAGVVAPVICEMSLHGSKALLEEYGVSIPDWESVMDAADVNAAMMHATDLFPEGAVELHGIKTFQGTRIDTAIVDAASVVCKANSVLRNTFLYIINGREELLKPVDSIQYEDLMGLSAWVDQKRILIGNRDLMIHHSVAVPKREYENQYREQGQEVIYLAREGELYAAFIVEFVATESVHTMLSILQRQKIGVVVSSVDAAIDADLLMRVFGLSSEEIKVIPARLHEPFEAKMQPRERMSITLLNSGDMESFAVSLAACKLLTRCVRFGKRLYLIGTILLSVLLTALFAFGQTIALSAAAVAACSIVLLLIYWMYQRNLRL